MIVKFDSLQNVSILLVLRESFSKNTNAITEIIIKIMPRMIIIGIGDVKVADMSDTAAPLTASLVASTAYVRG